MGNNKLPNTKDLELLRTRMATQFQLPSAYDDALSYQGLIYKLIQYLKDTMQNVEDWNNWLEDFVGTFDARLQDTVREKIQELYDSGQIAELVAQVIDVVQNQINGLEDSTEAKITDLSNTLKVDKQTLDDKINATDNRLQQDIQKANTNTLEVVNQLRERVILNDLDNEKIRTEFTNKDNEILNKLITAVSEFSTKAFAPLVVDAVSEMTDSARLYILKSTGNLYYHNGTSFIDSGITIGNPQEFYSKRTTISSGALAEYSQGGSYAVSGTNTITDLPDTWSGGGFLWNFIVPTATSQFATQMLVNNTLGKMYMRSLLNNGPTVWMEYQSKNTTYSYHQEKITSGLLSDYKRAGSYAVQNTNNEILDMPDGWTAGMLFNFKTHISGTLFYEVQFMITSAGEMATRSLLNDGPTKWNIYRATGSSGAGGNGVTSDTVAYFLGDSIEVGGYSYVDETDTVRTGINKGISFLQVAGEFNGYAKMVNISESGGGILKPRENGKSSFQNAITNNTFSDADLIVLGSYSNDRLDTTIQMGTSDDAVGANTMCGTLKWGIEEIFRKKPDVTLVLLSDINQYNDWYYQWAEQVQKICDSYRLKYINLLENTPFTTLNYDSLLLDKAHPTIKGHKILGKFIANMLPR